MQAHIHCKYITHGYCADILKTIRLYTIAKVACILSCLPGDAETTETC